MGEGNVGLLLGLWDDHPERYRDFSVFEKAVYREVVKIPLGEVRTYSDIAKAVGKPGAVRAVGQALKRNPFPIIIPCHRVVAKGGLGGFSRGTEEKVRLLELEKRIKEMLYGDNIS